MRLKSVSTGSRYAAPTTEVTSRGRSVVPATTPRMENVSSVSTAQGPKVRRLSAGGKWIRTFGSAREITRLELPYATGSGRREARTSPWVSRGFSMKLESDNKRAASNLSGQRVFGRCLCGAVELEIDFPAFWAWHDHSAASRRAHGAAYATYVGCWRKHARVAKGLSLIHI